MRKLIVSGAIALAALTAGAMAIAAESEEHPPHRHWHFAGPFGTFDRAAAQRGYQVYYRDPDPTFCPAPAGSGFNVSNALRVSWGG